jgi:hypothetical protein
MTVHNRRGSRRIIVCKIKPAGAALYAEREGVFLCEWRRRVKNEIFRNSADRHGL